MPALPRAQLIVSFPLNRLPQRLVAKDAQGFKVERIRALDDYEDEQALREMP
ncbi:MAG TPA: hypothetical protein PKO06_14330 [Candidatus Ozemobacteraceae bacterium]|nr:hypothetical protein [Candidatus Ozemobacteraceae bacterium]